MARPPWLPSRSSSTDTGTGERARVADPATADLHPASRGRNIAPEQHRSGGSMTKIFYVTDIHGSEICWRKFLNAGPFYGADVVDRRRRHHRQGHGPHRRARRPLGDHDVQDQHVTLETEDEVQALETKILNRGYYPIRVSDEEYRHMQEDEDAVDKRFKEVMLEGTERWIAMADDKLEGKVHPRHRLPGERRHVRDRPRPEERARGRVRRRGAARAGGLRDGLLRMDEPDAVEHVPRAARGASSGGALEKILEKVTDPSRTIFNFHAPPYGSGLDDAPALDADMNIKAGGRRLRPVGSTSVRSAIERSSPAVAARPHPRERRGRPGWARRLVLNPGSSYEEGVLQAAVDHARSTKKHKVKNYQLVNG